MEITVELGPRSYPVTIDNGLLEKFDYRRFTASQYVIITDENVGSLYAGKLRSRLHDSGLKVACLTMPAGEKAKSWDVAGRLADRLVDLGADNDSMLIALGGGVVGDITGFVASIYRRGIGYIQIPTSLMAQLDSSIGGKTGVNLHRGKNLIGTFHQPEVVVTDPSLLSSLPETELRSGLAEAIKYGMALDKNLFEFLESSIALRTPEF